MADGKDISGSFSAPPAGAPIESTQPVRDDVVAAQLAKAAANERTLAPFAPAPFQNVPRANAEVVLTDDFTVAPTEYVRPAEEPKPSTTVMETIRDRNPQPAASNTDSPSRGIPRPIGDPGKQITGGFGDPGAAQYFALDGSELKELVHKMLDEVNAKIEHDLRFHVAITYPRVTARVKIEVEGWAQDAGFTVQSIPVVHEKTPIAVAESMGAHPVAFAVTSLRREFDDDGNPENPPDRLRDELGLQKPRKQTIQAGGSRIIVDRATDLGGSF